MKVVAYLPSYNEKHCEILRAFAKGAGGVTRPLTKYEACDIAVIFGSVKEAYPPTWAKRCILENHRGRKLIIIESGFLLRGVYYQIGFGGSAGYADFRNKNSLGDRWQKFNTVVHPWRNNKEGPIVVCGQLPRDTQVQYVDHIGWCQKMVRCVQKQNLPVTFRPHPRVKDPGIYGIAENLLDIRSMDHTVKTARCLVTWNSTSGVDGVLAGVPVIAYDKGSIVWPLARHRIADIENLMYPERTQWCNDIGYAQWTIPEMLNGLPWQHLMRP